MTPQSKPVDLKGLLDKIEKIGPSSPEVRTELLKEFQLHTAHLREMDRKALQTRAGDRPLTSTCLKLDFRYR